MEHWYEIKNVITDFTALSRDTLHILTGCGAHLFLVLAFRSWIGALWPVGLVALAELINEYGDLASETWINGMRGQQYYESVKDIVLTLAIPVALLVLSRAMPGRFQRPVREAPASE